MFIFRNYDSVLPDNDKVRTFEHVGREFETGGYWYYLLVIPFTWLMAGWVSLKHAICAAIGTQPKRTSILYDREGSGGRFLKNNARSWKALDYLYNWKERGAKDWLDYFWIKNLINAKAVRNRFRMAKRILREEIDRQGKKVSEVRILSLASGSAQALIEVMGEFNNDPSRVGVKALLIDLKKSALVKAKEFAEKHGVNDDIEYRQETVGEVENVSGDFHPNIISMIGFLDYLRDDQMEEYRRMIQEGLEDGGVFITCNIFNNPERPFVYRVSAWPMIYRSPESLARLLLPAFQQVDLHLEPVGIHGIAVARTTKLSR